ncbi:MAG: hypothetical protein D6690_04565 [Nitrospirae bacterium]|nr:MAG: hypothetical protein D6690_04565 [Nitrospirota bacterium]
MTMAKAPELFIRALRGMPISCPRPSCTQPVTIEEVSAAHDRVKTFLLQCEACGWEDQVGGAEQIDPPWDESSLMAIIEEHLLHLEPVCPYDQAPLHFHSLPNPRRRARYAIFCYYCGRRTELDWPPEEAKW